MQVPIGIILKGWDQEKWSYYISGLIIEVALSRGSIVLS